MNSFAEIWEVYPRFDGKLIDLTWKYSKLVTLPTQYPKDDLKIVHLVFSYSIFDVVPVELFVLTLRLTSTPSNWDVILGEHNTRVEEGPEVTCSITQIFVHPNWNSKPFDYDVALLKISCDYEQSDEISNSCLPGPNITFNAGDNCVVTGWGLLAEDGMAF